jgi:hypothetical protein
MVDVYNEKLREFASRHPAFQKGQKHQFIDTNPIVGVIWDLSQDWCHIHYSEGIPEASCLSYYYYNSQQGWFFFLTTIES